MLLLSISSSPWQMNTKVLASSFKEESTMACSRDGDDVEATLYCRYSAAKALRA
jgi:hypothetical protein